MSDSGDSASTATASTSTAAVDAIDCDDPPLDLPNFFEAERHSGLDYVGTFLRVSIHQMYPPVANYDDKIVAELPHFLEMATYEDPMDDLAVFLKNACRWACCKRLVGPEGTFYLFAEFPCEVRLMIWRNCIPSQVHLVSEPVHGGFIPERVHGQPFAASQWMAMRVLIQRAYDQVPIIHHFHSRYCNSAHPMSSTQKTPVIAKVNHEARVLSLERKSKRYNLVLGCKGSTGWMDRIEEAPVWLDEKNDTVLINTQHIITARHPEDAVLRTEDGTLDYKADRLFGMVTRNKIQVAIFAAVMLDTEFRESAPLYQALASADRVDVVVGVLGFDGMSDNEAAVTELFGLFGEESVALVSVKDSASMLKLFKAHLAFRPECSAELLSRDDGEYCKQCYFYNPCTRGARRRRQPDFDEYYKEMLWFAWAALISCKDKVALRAFEQKGKEAGVQCSDEVRATFEDTFEPVFFLHRCNNPVLMNFRTEDAWF